MQVMKKRYYFTDPVAAAWMAKHFGMRIGAWRSGCFTEWPHWTFCLGDPEDSAQSGNMGFRPYGGPIHVHPESEILLEPQVGDCIEFPAAVPEHRFASVRDNEDDMTKLHLSFARYKASTGCVKVIQRDNKPFFWPESEEI